MREVLQARDQHQLHIRQGVILRVVDRIGLNIMRDDYTGASKGIVKFHARRRVGGKVVLPEAGVLLKTTESGE